MESREAKDLVELLQRRAEESPDKILFRHLITGDIDGGTLDWSNAELERRARIVAERLSAVGQRGDRALLLFAPGLDFISAYFGCIYAGLIAVPVYPPDPSRLPQTLPRLLAIINDAGARIVLTTSDITALGELIGQFAPELASLHWITVDDVPHKAVSNFEPRSAKPEEIAFLQYTSGSTGDPKGVMVSHANIIANQRMMKALSNMSGRDIGIGWVPLFHDLGLIGNVLHTLWVNGCTVLMSPLAVLKQPLRWLRAISHFKGTISGGPDFMYDLCARKVTAADLETLDLRPWRIAFSGAEPVRAATLDRFSKAFAAAGFDQNAFTPAFGLAEATLAVTGKPLSTPVLTHAFARNEMVKGRAILDNAANFPTHVSSGQAMNDVQVAIVAPDKRVRLMDGDIGEIWVQGLSVAQGYWGRPEKTAEVFNARIEGENSDPWLRTGDLGFLRDGELFVTGRHKDMIIIRGHNHYPQDIESTAEKASSILRPGCSVAFSVERGDAEAVVLVAEIDANAQNLHAALSAIARAVIDMHEISLDDIILIRPRTLRKTSSGKLQRNANKLAYLAGELDVVTSLRTAPIPVPEAPRVPEPPRAAASQASALDAATIHAKLVELLRQATGLSESSIGPDATVASLGLDSMKVAGIVGDLERVVGFEIPVEVFFGETLGNVAQAIASRQTERTYASVIDYRTEIVLPDGLCPQRPHEPAQGPIFLTGATGFVGAALLDELLARTTQTIHCLVRASDASAGMDRIREALRRLGRRDDDVHGRVLAICGDLALPRFGLEPSTFAKLALEIGAIYHCGATIHWAEPYSKLRAANVTSVFDVLALAAPKNVAVHYVSTLGVYPFGATEKPFFSEEADLEGFEHLRLGYFQTKWVADSILAAARRRGFVISTYRPGLVTGDSRTGIDAPGPARILGAFIAGCIRMGTAPLVDKIIDIVPVDYVAGAIAGISLRPESIGRSFNLVNPQPMRQIELYAALRDMGYPLREVPYPVWQKQVLALPSSDSQNPLARFALYYRTISPERMRVMERQTATRLPVEDRNTRAFLPSDVTCTAFDRDLLAIYVRNEQQTSMLPEPPARVTAKASSEAIGLLEHYDPLDERLSKLYARGKDKQWDAMKRLDWGRTLDLENPEMLPDKSLPIYGLPHFERLDAKGKARVRHHFQSWQVSQTLHGEQGALLCAAKIVQQAPTMDARLYAATQVIDEARHVELFHRLSRDKFGILHPMTTSLRKLLDDVLSDARWDMTFLGMQVLVEGLALAAFSLNRDQSRDPLVSAAYAYVIEDEARHVAFGRLVLKDYYPQLTQAERDEREEFAVEAVYLLRDRLQGDDIWGDLGFPVADVAAHIQRSSFQRGYRRELFSRIVPLIRSIGLWGPKIQSAFGDMGVLGFAQVDLDALAVEDERRVRDFEGQTT